MKTLLLSFPKTTADMQFSISYMKMKMARGIKLSFSTGMSILIVVIINGKFECRAPAVAPIRSKMLYAGTKGNFKNALVGIALEIQATDLGEADKEEVINKLKAFK
jgi:hypothetical protein